MLGKNTNVLKALVKSIKEWGLREGKNRNDMAEELGIQRGTLDNKLKASDMKVSFTAEEILAVCDVTDDDAPLKAMCAERGLVVYDPIELMPDGGDIMQETLIGVLKIDGATGDLSKLVEAAFEDGKIDAKEARTIANKIKTLASLERRLEVMLEKHAEVA